MTVRSLFFGTGPADFGLMIVRVFAGLSLAFAHGMGKLPPSEQFVTGVRGMGFPAPEAFAWLAALSEFAGGLLLALGLLTRPAALAIAITMGVAAFITHASDPFQKKELALFFLAVALCFLFSGAGKYSVDAAISGSKGTRRG